MVTDNGDLGHFLQTNKKVWQLFKTWKKAWGQSVIMFTQKLPVSALRHWSALGSTSSWVHRLSVKSVHSWSYCLSPTLGNSAGMQRKKNITNKHNLSALDTQVIAMYHMWSSLYRELHIGTFLWFVLHHSLNMKEWITDPCTITRTGSGVALKSFPYVSSVQTCGWLCCPWPNAGMHSLTLHRNVHMSRKATYRAGTSIHCCLIEGLTHSEGDMGGADAGGCLDWQTLSLLGDFHRRTGGSCHCYLSQEHIHTWPHTEMKY